MLRAASSFSPTSTAAHQPANASSHAVVPPVELPDDPIEIEVDPATASLTDLVRLVHLAASAPATAPLLAERVHGACWQHSRQVRLYFDTEPEQSPVQIGSAVGRQAGARSTVARSTVVIPAVARSTAPALTAAVELANETLAQMLHTTHAQLQLPDHTSPAAHVVRQYAHALDRSRRPQTVIAFKRMVRVAGEAIHREAFAQLPPVRAQVPQTPTDCMLRWISALRAAQQTHDGATDTWLQQTEAAARRRWMQHDLALPAVRSYFAQIQTECNVQGATGLATTVRKIAATLPSALQEEHFDTRLNDNVYGRVFETRLMAHLIASPPPGTLVVSEQLASALLHYFSELPPWIKSLVVNELSSTLVTEPRFWFDRVPKLKHFITAAPGEQKKRALANWLSTPPVSAYDCMAITLCACQLSLALKMNAAEFAPWMRAADINYGQSVQPASRRLKNMPEPLLRPEGGIVLLHQRPAFSHLSMRPGMRASLQHRPNLESRSAVTRHALAHGLPYASGVSGSTNILLHQAVFFGRRGITFDVRQLLLAALMLLNGGHSLHEVLWIAHQLDQPLKLGLALSDARPDAFISDYDRFIDLYTGADRLAIEQAVAAAWNDTIDYARLPVA